MSYGAVWWLISEHAVSDDQPIVYQMHSKPYDQTQRFAYFKEPFLVENKMGVSKIRGTVPPKSSILIGFSIILTIHFGVPLFLETPILIRGTTENEETRELLQIVVERMHPGTGILQILHLNHGLEAPKVRPGTIIVQQIRLGTDCPKSP